MTLAAHADPITFTMSYTGSGIFDGSTFTNALVTITSTSDSAFIQSNQRLYLVDGTSVTVAGLGTDSLSGIFENQIYTDIHRQATKCLGRHLRQVSHHHASIH